MTLLKGFNWASAAVLLVRLVLTVSNGSCATLEKRLLKAPGNLDILGYAEFFF